MQTKLEWINLIEAEPKDTDYPHCSSFGITSRKPKELFVSGVLPHGFTFTIRNEASRDRLIEFLQAMEFTGATK